MVFWRRVGIDKERQFKKFETKPGDDRGMYVVQVRQKHPKITE